MNPRGVEIVARSLYAPVLRGPEVDAGALAAEAERLVDGCWNVARVGDAFVCSLLASHPELWEGLPAVARVTRGAIALRWREFVGASPPPEEWDAVYARLKDVTDEKRGRLLLAALVGDAAGVVEMFRSLVTIVPVAGWRATELESERERVSALLREYLTPWLEASFGDDELSFLEAMRVAPDDWGTVAVYVDWLAERDDPRAAMASDVLNLLRTPDAPPDVEPIADDRPVRLVPTPAAEESPFRVPTNRPPRLPDRLGDAARSPEVAGSAWRESPEERAERMKRQRAWRRRALLRVAAFVSAIAAPTSVVAATVKHWPTTLLCASSTAYGIAAWQRRGTRSE